ncbi:hypothetical protein D5086_017588 [Populus alba]|uniref:Uncharacterized protein n=1 Tax=Populus alba TaxID=43335 RepID=A0ACC4BPJ2_POPAL
MSNSSENEVESLPQIIGDKSYKEARKEEADSFENHPLDKSMVGIPVLAQKLVHTQATIIARCLPEIVRTSNEKLNASVSELNRMPKTLSSVGEALTTFMGIVGSAKESLNKIIFCVRNLVNKELQEEIVQELVGRHDGAIERMLEESPAVAAKREKLNVSIKLLRESSNVLGNIMDKIASNV